MNEFRFICARLIMYERVLKILSVTERHRLGRIRLADKELNFPLECKFRFESVSCVIESFFSFIRSANITKDHLSSFVYLLSYFLSFSAVFEYKGLLRNQRRDFSRNLENKPRSKQLKFAISLASRFILWISSIFHLPSDMWLPGVFLGLVVIAVIVRYVLNQIFNEGKGKLRRTSLN